jgi:hypothetical protein
MQFVRFSAVEQFGVPLGVSEQPDNATVARLLAEYSVEPQEISPELTDITPYYWREPDFRYFLSMSQPEGPAVLDMMPAKRDSTSFDVMEVAGTVFAAERSQRSIVIPTDHDVALITGYSPRYTGQLCIHELIACLH